MQGDAVAYLAVVIDGDIGIEKAIFADGCIVIYGGVGINLRPLPDFDVLADVGKRSHVTVFPDLGCRSNISQRVNAFFLGFAHCIKGQQAGYRLVCVVNPDERGFCSSFQFQVFVHQHDA